MITYRTLQFQDEEQFKNLALKAWKFTYKNIFTDEFIQSYINSNYSPEAFQMVMKYNKDGKGETYVAVEDNKMVGYAGFGKNDTGFRLFRIYLDPDYIGKGVGTKLLELGEELLKKMGAKEYDLYVHRKNELGKEFYFKKGFIEDTNESNNPDSELRLVKKLR